MVTRLEVDGSHQLRHRLEIGLAGLGVDQIGRHGQIALHQRVPRETPDIGSLDEEAVAEFPADGEIQVHGVGRGQLRVDAVGDREGARGAGP